MNQSTPIKALLEAALFAAAEPLSVDRILALFDEAPQPARHDIQAALNELQEEYRGRGVELKRVGSGYRFQVGQDYGPWVRKLWAQRSTRYSRALMETLAIIAYRQPLTRAEVESIRGVSLSSNIIKTLLDREWIRVVGHRDVPGKPAVYGTTKHFLDYFNLASLNELPPLDEIRDIAEIAPELDLEEPDPDGPDGKDSEAQYEDPPPHSLRDDGSADQADVSLETSAPAEASPASAASRE